jgi:meromycolic acid enoyl-[acyl-carrier-protein] reductase
MSPGPSCLWTAAWAWATDGTGHDWEGNGMGILDGKQLLITGVLTDSSIAFHVARLAQQEGATVVLTGFGRLSLVERIAKRLPEPPPVLELDVTDAGHLDSLAERVCAHVDRLDGVVHAIANAPQAAMGGNFLTTEWPDVASAVQVSAYSLKALAIAALPLMPEGGSIVGLDFDAAVAWPAYDWMGVAKAALESTTRYLARDLGPRGVRVNLVAAGPIKTIAMRSIPGAEKFEGVWADRAPLGWDIEDAEPAARGCIALLSDWFPATTGEIVHVDGGVHAVGA